MNISDLSARKACTSCQLCAAVCAKGAISIVLDKDGFYHPIVETSLCNDCGLCTSVCYKFDKDVLMTTPDGLDKKPLYSAWSNNDELVKQTTSGGIGDLLAHQLQKEGYKVVGVVYNEEETRAEHKIARDKEDLCGFRGSKYIQSYTFDTFKEVVENCRKENYAVFGTPCQIYALNRLVTKRNLRDHFFFVDLYCHGCPSLFAWEKYQNGIKKKIGVNKFDSVTFRSKVRGWGSFNVAVEVEGNTFFVGNITNDKFYELFFSDLILNDACSECSLRSTLEYTDIRLGDFWGHKYLRNQRGVSAVSICTGKGGEIFNRLDSLVSSRCSYDEFLRYQSWGRKYKVDQAARKAVIGSLADSNLDIDDAIRVLRRHQGLTKTLKRYIKSLLSFFPQGVANYVKELFYKVW